jgi:hypothetical protein
MKTDLLLRFGSAPAGLAVLTALFSTLAGPAAAREVTRRIRFAPGSSAAVVKGAVVRGDRAVYLLRARAGETMTVRLTAVERNAALVILPPGQQKPLRGAEEGADATSWTGKLPKPGDYRLRVGSTRGNATYRLRVMVRRPAARRKG